MIGYRKLRVIKYKPQLTPRYGSVVGELKRSFWQKEGPKIDASIADVARKVGKRNIASVFLCGSAADHVTGARKGMSKYRDIDLIFVIKNRAYKKHKDALLGAKDKHGYIDKLFLSHGWVENATLNDASDFGGEDYTLITIAKGIPIHGGKKGFKIQKKVVQNARECAKAPYYGGSLEEWWIPLNKYWHERRYLKGKKELGI